MNQIIKRKKNFQEVYLNDEKENKIINWIKENRYLGIAISTFHFLLYVQKIKPEFKDKKNHAKKELIYRFLYRNGYSFRRPSHVG